MTFVQPSNRRLFFRLSDDGRPGIGYFRCVALFRSCQRYLLPSIAYWLFACSSGDIPSAREYVSTHSHAIRSLTDTDDFSDLTPIAAAIGDARIVQLGESSHGSGSMMRMKTRLVEYLHEHHGFNVLAFESSFFACSRGLETSPAVSAQALMQSCASDVMRARELLPLFEYIKDSQRSARPLQLGGVDVQPNSAETPELLTEFYRAATAGLDARLRDALLDTVVAVHQLQIDGNRCYGWGDEKACVRTRSRYHSVHTALLQQLPLADEFSGPGGLLAGLLLPSYVHAVDWQLQKASANGRLYDSRDNGMAVNTRNLIERLHPGEKLLLWAHNVHIAEDFPHAALRDSGEPVMGMHLRERFGRDLYTIGLFMLTGSQADNARSITPVTAHRPDSLEGLFMHLPYPISFMVLPKADEPGEGDDWLHRPTIYKESGRFEDEANLARSFDAVLMIRDAKPPTYLTATTP